MLKQRILYAFLVVCLLAYCMDALAAQMAVTSALHLTRFPAAKGRTPHDMPAIFISFSTVRLHVCLGRPLDRFPAGFHRNACLVILLGSFLMVCPIHFHFLSLMVWSIGFCSASFHRSSFVIHAGQKTFKMIRRQWFRKVWSFFRIASVICHVSDPYNSTDLTLLLNSLNLVFLVISLDFQILNNAMKACRALRILASASSSAPPDLLTKLPR